MYKFVGEDSRRTFDKSSSQKFCRLRDNSRVFVLQSFDTIFLDGFDAETRDHGVSSFDESGHDVGLPLLELLEDGGETHHGAKFELKLEHATNGIGKLKNNQELTSLH